MGVKVGLTLREKTIRVFENRALGIFRPKREEVTEGWRKLHITCTLLGR